MKASDNFASVAYDVVVDPYCCIEVDVSYNLCADLLDGRSVPVVTVVLVCLAFVTVVLLFMTYVAVVLPLLLLLLALLVGLIAVGAVLDYIRNLVGALDRELGIAQLSCLSGGGNGSSGYQRGSEREKSSKLEDVHLEREVCVCVTKRM